MVLERSKEAQFDDFVPTTVQSERDPNATQGSISTMLNEHQHRDTAISIEAHDSICE